MEQKSAEEIEAKETEPETGLALLEPARLAIEHVRPRDTLFWRALAVAVLLHAAMFIHLGSSSSHRRMGEQDGDPNAISVDVMDESGLPSLATPPAPPPTPPTPPTPDAAEQPPTPPTPPAPQAEAKPVELPVKEPPRFQPPPAQPPVEQPPAEQQPAEQPPSEAPQDTPVKQARAEPDIRGTTDPDRAPSQDTVTEPSPPPPAQPPPKQAVPSQPRPPERPVPQKSAEAAALEKEMLEMFAPDPARRNQPKMKPSPTQPSQPSQPSPLDAPTQFQSNSSSFARPVDISRTGENDEFGRGVIRALRQTMPRPVARARVTIKFYLSESGEVADMRLVQGSGYPLMDQFVLLAASNSSFPRPPPGSKTVDRMFLVTYIYD